MNTDIWVAGTSNQLFIRSSFTEPQFPPKKILAGNTPFFELDPLGTPHFIHLHIGF